MNSSNVIVPTGHTVAMIAFSKTLPGDCLSERMVQELKRRMQVFTLNPKQQIVRSVTPPNDKTVYWLPVDENGNVTGVLQSYDSGSGTWIEVSAIGQCISQDVGNLLKADGDGCLLVAVGNVPGYTEITAANLTPTGGVATQAVAYTGMTDQTAQISVEFSGDPGPDGRWWVTDKINTGCNVQFAGLAGNVSCQIYARRSTQTLT